MFNISGEPNPLSIKHLKVENNEAAHYDEISVEKMIELLENETLNTKPRYM